MNFQPIAFDFKTKTYDFEADQRQSTVAKRHVLSYGGNLRFNNFDLSLAPDADNRTEFGVYGQDEIFLSDQFRWIVGARVDRFDYIDDFVFSPRTTFMFKPTEQHALRLSYNRAYRSPSVINNFLDVTVVEPINLAAFSPALAGRVYPLPIQSVGNPDLTVEKLDAFEIGYTGFVGGPRDALGRLLRQQGEERHLLHRGDQRALHRDQPAARLAAAARGHRARARRAASRRSSPI